MAGTGEGGCGGKHCGHLNTDTGKTDSVSQQLKEFQLKENKVRTGERERSQKPLFKYLRK